MLVDVIMPKMGESIMDGKIIKWYKSVGDTIAKDETLLEISTDKVDTEVPTAEAGIVAELLYQEGDTANVGDVIAKIETDTSKTITPGSAEPKKEEKQVEEKPSEKKPDEEKPQPPESKTEEPVKEVKEEKTEVTEKGGASFYSPLVMSIASKEGVSMDELTKIKGTGISGRIRKQDILAYVESRGTKKETKKEETQQEEKPYAQAPEQKTEKPKTQEAAKPKEAVTPAAPAKASVTSVKDDVEVIQMDTLQEKMAEHMVMSVQTSPHVAAIAECDMTAVEKAKMELEGDFLKREGFKLTYMPFVCEATIKALKDFPLVNASIDGKRILLKKHINLGIAVAMENGGLIVPVIKHSDSKNLIGIARDINDLAGRARKKKLTLDEIEGGTFTITNYGIFGNDIGTPIINQPNLAILGTGAIKKKPVVIETEHGDSIAIKPMMFLTLSFDHRIIDGALGGKFLMRIVEYIENYSL